MTWDVAIASTDYFQIVIKDLKNLLDCSRISSRRATIPNTPVTADQGPTSAGRAWTSTGRRPPVADRQLHAPQSGVYYLQVTRIRPPCGGPTQPGTYLFRSSSLQVVCSTGTFGRLQRIRQPFYTPGVAYRRERPSNQADGNSCCRNALAMPYYELSVEVRGPTLSSISITAGDPMVGKSSNTGSPPG